MAQALAAQLGLSLELLTDRRELLPSRHERQNTEALVLWQDAHIEFQFIPRPVQCPHSPTCRLSAPSG